MKPEELLYSMDHVGEDLLAAAEQTVLVRRRRPWLKTAVAAVLVLTIGAGGFLALKALRPSAPVAGSEPTGVSIPETPAGTGGQENPESDTRQLRVGQSVRGMSVLPLADPEAYLASNPWRETQRLNTLPVYRAEELERGFSTADWSLLLQRALETLECGTVKDFELSVSGEPILTADTELGSLRIDRRGQITLLLDAAQRLTPELPAETDGTAPGEETLVRCWLDWLSQFTKLNPASRWALVEGTAPATVTVAGVDEPLYRAEVYPLLSGDERSQAVAYSLERLTLLYRDDCLYGFTMPGLRLHESHLEEVLYDGAAAQSGANQTVVGVGHPLLWDLVGNYPLLDPAEARAMALEGQTLLAYEEAQITGRYLDLPNDDRDPAELLMDLVYLPNESGELLLPCYRFLWPAEKDEDGNSVYHLSYVPAVDPMFLEDWPPEQPAVLTALDPAEEAEVRALFDPEGPESRWYCRALGCRFANLLELDLGTLLCGGFPGVDDSLSAAEREDLRALGADPGLGDNCRRLPGGEVDAVLTRLFGTDRELLAKDELVARALRAEGVSYIDVMAGGFDLVIGIDSASPAYRKDLEETIAGLLGEGVSYLPDLDCYYDFRPDPGVGSVTVLALGRDEAGRVLVSYNAADMPDGRGETIWTLGLWKDEEAYRVLFNLPGEWVVPEGALVLPAASMELPDGFTAPDSLTSRTVSALFADGCDWYCRALLNCYSNPLDADLEQLFYLGIPDMGELSQAEREKLEALGHQEIGIVGCQRMPGAEVDAVLTRLFGLTRQDYADAGKGDLVSLLGSQVEYLPEYDCYYGFRSDAIGGPVTIRGVGYSPDGVLTVFYGDPGGERIVYLRPAEDGYQILSNLPAEWNAGNGKD